MKKALAVIVAILMAAALFSACAREERDEHIEPEETKIRHRATDQNVKDDDDDRRRFRLPGRLRRHRTQSTE